MNELKILKEISNSRFDISKNLIESNSKDSKKDLEISTISNEDLAKFKKLLDIIDFKEKDDKIIISLKKDLVITSSKNIFLIALENIVQKAKFIHLNPLETISNFLRKTNEK